MRLIVINEFATESNQALDLFEALKELWGKVKEITEAGLNKPPAQANRNINKESVTAIKYKNSSLQLDNKTVERWPCNMQPYYKHLRQSKKISNREKPKKIKKDTDKELQSLTIAKILDTNSKSSVNHDALINGKTLNKKISNNQKMKPKNNRVL